MHPAASGSGVPSSQPKTRFGFELTLDPSGIPQLTGGKAAGHLHVHEWWPYANGHL